MSKRTCRACGASYTYPVARSLATRFHCEKCAALPRDVRERFEAMHKRITRLEKQLERVAGGAPAPKLRKPAPTRAAGSEGNADGGDA